MPAISCSAPGKVILCGEHAVVYGRPAIALPVFSVKSTCRIIAQPNLAGDSVSIEAPNINLKTNLLKLEMTHPIRQTVEQVLGYFNMERLPNCSILIHSSIPPAAGLGSSASSTIAMIRAISTFLGHPLDISETNRIAFEIEKIHHGAPSGIDNTVIAYGKPLFFRKQEPFELLKILTPFTIVITDTGIKSSTAKVVSELKNKWKRSTRKYESFFDQIEAITIKIKHCLNSGEYTHFGNLLNQNQEILRDMGVSCQKLDDLVKCALEFGAIGAKLSGGGQGGNMITLVEPQLADTLATRLSAAGAARTLIMTISPESGDCV
ncbi:MAG: mevalonate kinase [Chloroflexi bacterium]|nr:mevalonate kinase [Chloroflexota bacterium]